MQRLHAHAALAQAGGVEPHMHRAAGATNGHHLAGAGHALQLGFYRMRHTLQVVRALGIFRPQRGGQHRHVVNAFGLDDRGQHAQALGQPVLVGVEYVVQPHQRLGARHTHLELHGEHGHAGARHRVGVLNALDLREHMLRRGRDHFFHVGAGSPREGDQHVGHGHVDLRLFFARGDQHGKQTQQQGHQRQQRRDGVALKHARHRARKAQLFRGGVGSGFGVAHGGILTGRRAQRPTGRRAPGPAPHGRRLSGLPTLPPRRCRGPHRCAPHAAQTRPAGLRPCWTPHTRR